MLFAYQISGEKGEIKKGQIDAVDLREAKAKLSTLPGTLLMLSEIKSKKNTGLKMAFGRVSLADRMMFAKHLTVMIRSGMPLDEALDTIKDQSSPVLSNKLHIISEDVKKGNSLSNSLRRFPKVFDNLFVNMVAAGEVGGTLVKNLEIVATHQQKSYALRTKIKSAIMYPIVIFLAIIGLIVVISVYVLPKLLGFFKSLNATLPLSTKLLILGGDLFLSYWKIFFIGLFLFIILIRILIKFPKPRLFMHKVLLHLPIAGKISKNLNWTIFARSLSSLLNSGVPIDQALRIVAQTQTNDAYKDEVTIIYHQAVKGVAMSDILEHSKYFPILFSRMSRVGERSGNLSETLDYLADFYETEVDNYTKNLSTMLEPILLVTIGLLVGFVAMSIINPIYELTSKVVSNLMLEKKYNQGNTTGFTLIEIMTIVVVFAVILSSVVALTTDKTPREDLEAKARQVVDLLSRAHNYALSGYHGDAWGVKVLDNSADCVVSGTGDCVVIFKGKSYVSRTSSYDEKVVFDTGVFIEANQVNEYYFKKSSGWLASTTAISDQALIIKNNFDSQKTVTTTLTGLIYFGN